MVTNLNTTIKVPEPNATRALLYSVSVTDADKYNAILYRVRAIPEEGLDYYSVDISEYRLSATHSEYRDKGGKTNTKPLFNRVTK